MKHSFKAKLKKRLFGIYTYGSELVNPQLTPEELAKHIGIHRSYLTTIFKKRIGISPQEYLLQCRLRHACKLLSETNNPIQEIARNVGYDNPLTFSKIFKSYYGISPRTFREQQKTKSQGE